MDAEANTTAIEAPPTANNGTPVEAQAEKNRDSLFRWSEYVHAGPGAEECEHGTDGQCREAEHFHAWIRLPNGFQVRDIRDKALAAQARKLRDLRSEEGDSRVVLENDLTDFTEADKELLIDSLVDKDWAQDYLTAVREIDDEDDDEYVPKDDDEIPKKWAHIDQDREEYQRQQQLPEEQRSEDFSKIEERLAEHGRQIEEKMKAIQAPRREQFAKRDFADLLELFRRDRIEAIGNEAYLHEYNTWTWYVCTYKPRSKGTPNERVWGSVTQMKYEAPSDVLEALREHFGKLEQELAGSRQAKNS